MERVSIRGPLEDSSWQQRGKAWINRTALI